MAFWYKKLRLIQVFSSILTPLNLVVLSNTLLEWGQYSQILGCTNRAGNEFHLRKWVPDPNKVVDVSHNICVILLPVGTSCQASPYCRLRTLCNIDDYFSLLVIRIATSKTKKTSLLWMNLPGNCEFYFSTFCDSSVWCLQQQGLIVLL